MEKETFFKDLIVKIYKRLTDREDLRGVILNEMERTTDVMANRYRRLICDDLANGATVGELKERLNKLGSVDRVHIAASFSYKWRRAFYEEGYAILFTKVEDSDPDFYWSDLFSEIVQGNLALNELFIRRIEEQEETQIKDVAHLQDLTGLTEVWGHEEGEITTEEEAKKEALRQLEASLNEARLYRYLTAVEDKLRSGALYPEVAAIELSAYGLPETFTADGREYTKDSALGHAIALATDLLTKEDSVDLKALAKQLQAPYTVLLEANDIRNELVTDFKEALQ